MLGGSKGNDRAAINGHYRELWGRRPLSTWSKTAANKKLCRRLERHAANQEVKRVHHSDEES